MLSANIMLLGRSGAGKSEFINYLMNDCVAPTGHGEPVTDAFDEYEYVLEDGFKIRIFDSKGLEVEKYSDICEGILSFVSDRCNSEHVSEWIHTIFYCINIERSRFGKEEEVLIQKLKEITGNVIIIITHCHSNNDSGVQYMIEKIYHDLGCNMQVFCVNSVAEKKKTGETIPLFGKEHLVKKLEQILWDNTVREMAKQYALDLDEGLHNLVEDMRSSFLETIRTSSRRSLQRKTNIYEDAVDDSFNATIAFNNNLNSRYEQLINEYADIHKHVSNTINEKIIDECSPMAFSYNVLVDEGTNRELKAWYENRKKQLEDHINEDGVDILIDGIDYIKNYKKIYEESINVMFDSMKSRIPSQEEVSDEVLSMLQEARKESLRHIPTVRLFRKIGLNEPCPCGSGRKYKKCCKGKGIFE